MPMRQQKKLEGLRTEDQVWLSWWRGRGVSACDPIVEGGVLISTRTQQISTVLFLVLVD